MILPIAQVHDRILGFEFTGKLHESDYHNLVPRVEEVIQRHGKARLLVWFHDFDGWDVRAFWRDLRFSVSHYETIEKFAVVGEERWQKALIELAKPLTKADVRYYPEDRIEEAWAWLDAD